MAEPLLGGGVLWLGLEGRRLAAEERRLLGRVQPSGLVLFQRNVGAAEELVALIAELRALLPGAILAVDSEGGRVDRLREVVGAAPAAAELARLPPAWSRRSGHWVGSALRAFDFDLDLAPVVDLDHGLAGNALDRRSFGAEPRRVVARARAFALGLREAGVGACLKHYPGLGAAPADTHLAPARIALPRARLARDLLPFVRLAAERPECVLVGHGIYPVLDPTERPASLSPAIAGPPLRRALGFRGAVLSDDLEMGALGPWGDLPERGAAALAAGCDALLFCRRLEEAPRIAEGLARAGLRERLAAANARLRRLRRRLDALRRAAPAPPTLPEIRRGLARLRERAAAPAS